MKYLISVISLLLVGCAGSPIHTSSMNQYEIMHVDDVALCRASIPRSAYTPSSVVILEVRRRQIDCKQLLPYEQPMVAPVQQQQPQTIIIQQQAPNVMQNPNACIQDGGSISCPNHPNTRFRPVFR